MKKIIPVLLVLVIAAALFHGRRWAATSRPQRHTDTEEGQVGRTVAQLCLDFVPDAREASIVYLYAQTARPYDARSRSLREDLAARRLQVNEIWARDEGHYVDEDYSPSIDAALRRHPGTSVLVVVSAGFVTHARISPTLRSFLGGGGRLVLVGSTHDKAPLTNLARNGQATILARRQTWLAESAPHPQLAEAPVFVRSNYTILDASSL